MTKGAFRLPIIGGAAPDPFPASDGWTKILEFQTNSPSTTTFDPTIVATSGTFGWDLGDGTIIYWDKAISHTYADSTTKTVKLYGKGTCTITQIDFRSDNLIGTLNLSNNAFRSLNVIYLQSNSLLTNVLFPSTSTGTIANIYIYSTGITGVLDLSMFTAFNSAAILQLQSNPSMTNVLFAPTITGTLDMLQLQSCNITGVLDLSMFTAFSINVSIQLHLNPSMTNVLFASTVAGNTKTLYLYGCTSLGYVDVSMLFTSVANLSWRFDGNGWSAAMVNQLLSVTDIKAVSGLTGRIINVGGTNTDPDATSGGFDGVAARNSLIAKGFTVTIT